MSTNLRVAGCAARLLSGTLPADGNGAYRSRGRDDADDEWRHADLCGRRALRCSRRGRALRPHGTDGMQVFDRRAVSSSLSYSIFVSLRNSLSEISKDRDVCTKDQALSNVFIVQNPGSLTRDPCDDGRVTVAGSRT